MPAQVTTRAQVNGYRFLIRRLEHALIRADSRMIHDPMRGQMRSLLIGLVVSVLITGAAGVLAFFKPTPNIGDAQILLSNANGALFVRIGDRVHPVLNLASARLIVGKSAAPKDVDDKFLNQLALGPIVGIIGAPSSIGAPADPAVSSWAVCDTTRAPALAAPARAAALETTVLANDPVLDGDIRAAGPDEVILARTAGSVFLVYQGVRAAVDVTDAALMRALHLAGAPLRDLSPGLLNAIPLMNPIVPVSIPGAGETTDVLGPDYPVGSILRVSDSRGDQLFAVLRQGIQPISEAAADIIRYTGGAPTTDLGWRGVSPALVSKVPVVHDLPVDHYPTLSPRVVDVQSAPVVCLAWQRAGGAARATTRLLIGNGLPLPRQAQPAPLATADGSGPALDSVYLKPGTGQFVQATGVPPDSHAAGGLFYVSDVGTRFAIKDPASAAALGMSGAPSDKDANPTPQLAPWPILALLPPGPELSADAALIAHDGMPPDAAGQVVALPKN